MNVPCLWYLKACVTFMPYKQTESQLILHTLLLARYIEAKKWSLSPSEESSGERNYFNQEKHQDA